LITVLPALSYGTASTSGSTTICYNTAPTGISTSGATGSGSFTYQWYSQTGAVTPTPGVNTGWTLISGQTSTSLTASDITANTTYACWVTPGGSPSCGSANWAGASNTDKVQITIYPVPTATASRVGSYEICPDTDHSPFNPDNNGPYNSGTTNVDYIVTRTSGGTGAWEFDFTILVGIGADYHPEYVKDTIVSPGHIESGYPHIVMCDDNDAVNLRFEIKNVPGKELLVTFMLGEVRNSVYDNNTCIVPVADPPYQYVDKKISAMPSVGPFE
jgi:hypothetical protein